jgi:hypothetical protein
MSSRAPNLFLSGHSFNASKMMRMQAEMQSKVLDILRAKDSDRNHPEFVLNLSNVSTEHMAEAESRRFMQFHIGKLQSASVAWIGFGHPVNCFDTECLFLYDALFADMVQHGQIWNQFVENIKNTCWCETIVGLVNSYAKILIQRAEKQRKNKDEQASKAHFRCNKVLNLGCQLLRRYKDSLTNPQFLEVVIENDAAKFLLDQRYADSLSCMDLLVKHGLLLTTGRGHNIAPSEVRFLCMLELDPLSEFHLISGQGGGSTLTTLMTLYLNRPCSRPSLLMTTDVMPKYQPSTKLCLKPESNPNRYIKCVAVADAVKKKGVA